MLTTFYLTKNDHRWVTFISLKTITLASPPPSPRSPSQTRIYRHVNSVSRMPNSPSRLEANSLKMRFAQPCLSLTLVERFDRRGIEPFELFRPEFGQIFLRIEEILLELMRIFKSKISGMTIVKTFLQMFREILRHFRQNLSKSQ